MNAPDVVSANPNLVEMTGVSTWQGRDRRSITNCDLAVGRGEIVVVRGPRVAGKSALIRSIVGLEVVSAGNIMAAGIEVTSSTIDLRRLRTHVGFVDKGSRLFRRMSLMENLCIAQQMVHGRPRDEAEARVINMLDRFDRRRYVTDARPGDDSERLVVIIRALLLDPQVLLLDHPEYYFPPRMMVKIWNNLSELAATGAAVIITSPNNHEFQEIETKSITMEAGRIIATSHRN